MGFGHPTLALLGAVLAATPVVVHLLTRPRPVNFPFSAMRFLREAERAEHWVSRLRDLLVLLCRTLAMLCLAAAIGKIRPAGLRVVSPDERTARVLVLDVSRSMNARPGGVSVFERARARAAQNLSYRPNLRAALILAGAQARPVFEELSANLAALRQELRKVSAQQEELDASASLAAAAKVLGSSREAGRQELIIITDLQRSNWASADFSVLPENVDVTIESAVGKLDTANLAVTKVQLESRVEQGKPSHLQVEVANYSGLQRQQQLEVRIGEKLYCSKVELAPWAREMVNVEFQPGAMGWLAGEARLTHAQDVLPDDNQRSFVVPVVSPVAFAIVTEESSHRVGTSSYYLERAIDPAAGTGESGGRVRATRLHPGAVGRDVLSTHEVLCLVRPGKLAEEQIGLVASLILRGKVCLYVAQEAQDAENLTRLSEALGEAARVPVAFAPPRRGRQRRDLILARFDETQAPFNCFAEALRSRLSGLRFSGGLMSSPRPEGLPEEVLAHFSDGSAALVVTGAGSGCLAVLNMNLAASSLVKSPLFVPFVHELAEAMLNGNGGLSTAADSGKNLSLYLAASVTGTEELAVLGPGDVEATKAEFIEDQVGTLLRWKGPGPPGVYRVRQSDSTVLALAIECPASESDLRVVEAETIKTRLAGARRVAVRGAGDEGEDEGESDIWRYFILACVFFGLTELAVLKWFRI